MRTIDKLLAAAIALVAVGSVPAVANANPYWQSVSGCASWIAASGGVYAVGCDSSNDKSLWKRVGSSWSGLPGSGVQISEGYGSPSSLWLRKSDGTIHKWTGSNWGSALPGPTGGNACSSYIAAGQYSTLWALGCESTPNKSIWLWSETPYGHWIAYSGGAKQIAVNFGSGYPYVLSSSNTTWHWTGSAWAALSGTSKQLPTRAINAFYGLGVGNSAIYQYDSYFGTWTNCAESTPNSPTKMYTGCGEGDYAINEDGEIFVRTGFIN